MRQSVVLVCALALGCSSGSGGGGNGGGGGSGPIVVTEDTFAEALIQAACSGGAQCCPAEGKTFSSLGCQASMGLVLGMYKFAKGLAQAHGMPWNQANADACVASLAAAAKSCGAQNWDATGCDQAYTPVTEPGALCDTDDQCIPASPGTARCEYPVEGDKYCLQIQYVAEGESCNNFDAKCDPDGPTWCDYTSSTCQPKKGAGEACMPSSGFDEECQKDLRCTGTCVPLGEFGDTCSLGGDCKSGLCNNGTCDKEFLSICQ
jgi:hypothetical protein